MKVLKLCPKCRRRLVPQCRGLVGAWWCERCECAYTQRQVEQFFDNQPGKKVTMIR